MPVLGLVVALALVAANAFFVAAEFTLARVRPTQVAGWERARRPGAGSLRHAVEHIDAYLAACQLGITIASLGLGAVGEPAFHDLLEPVLGDSAQIAGAGLAAAAAFVIITGLHVVVGELSPKSVAIARTEWVALAMAPPMRIFYLATKPMVDLLNGLANLALKPFGIPPARDAEDAPPSEDELHELLRASNRHGVIDHAELVLSENALELDDVPVREVMVPRADLPYVTTDGDVDTVIAHMRDSGVLRLPLCEPDGGLDAAVGVIEPEALVLGFADGGRPSSLTAAAGPLDRVPDGTAIQEVLTRMRRGHLHFVLAVDEHGTTVGGVSHEQITDVLTRGLDDEATERPAAY